MLLDSLVVSCKNSKAVYLVHGFCDIVLFTMGIIRQEWIPDSWADGSFFSDGVVPTRRDSSTNGNPEGTEESLSVFPSTPSTVHLRRKAEQ